MQIAQSLSGTLLGCLVTHQSNGEKAMKKRLALDTVYALMIVAVLLLAAPTAAHATTQTFEVRVVAGDSDAEEDSLGAVNLMA